MSKIATDAGAVRDLLDSAERYGIPMPYHAAVNNYSHPHLSVRTIAEWDAWRDYLDPGAKLEALGDDTQLWLTGTAYECDVVVVAVLTTGEPSAHLATIEGAKHVARAPELGTVGTTD